MKTLTSPYAIPKHRLPTFKVLDLSQYISHISNIQKHLNIAAPKTLWFRGQADASWDLLPSIYRNRNLNYYEREVSRDFKLLTADYLQERPQSDVEWMFLMQHYGLQTRLLDWTESHLTALFFAVSDYRNPVDAAVWVFRPAILNLAVLGEITIVTAAHPAIVGYLLGPTHLRERRIKAIAPIAIRPERNSARICAQKGGFTLHGRSPKGLNAFVAEVNRGPNRPIPLYKFIIPGPRKKPLVSELSLAGISNSVIFPELQGICAELRLKYSDDFALPPDLSEL